MSAALPDDLTLCGARRGGPSSRTFCELPPGHEVCAETDAVIWQHKHTGRTPSGRWYSWSPEEKE